MLALVIDINWSSTVTIAIGGTALIAFGATFWKYIGSPAYIAAKTVTWLIDTQPKIDHIVSELTPNHGSSVKDQVSNIHTAVRAISEKVDAHSVSTKAAATLAATAVGRADDVEAKVDEVRQQIALVDKYVHDFVHDFRDIVTPIQGAAHVTLSQEDERQTAIRTREEE